MGDHNSTGRGNIAAGEADRAYMTNLLIHGRIHD